MLFPILRLFAAVLGVATLVQSSDARAQGRPRRTTSYSGTTGFEARGSTVLPYNIDSPGATPAYQPRQLAVLLPITNILDLVGATEILTTSPLEFAYVARLRQLDAVLNSKSLVKVVRRDHAERQLLGLAAVLGGLGLGGILPTPTPTISPVLDAAAPSTSRLASSAVVLAPDAASTSAPISAIPSPNVKCLDSTVTELEINSILSHGGPGTGIFLCPSAVILISNPIIMTATNQSISTLGLPTDDTRATIRIIGLLQSNAITGSCGSCNYASLRNIQVDGARPALGWIPGPTDALLEMGGSNVGHFIDQVHAYEPRGWSAAHLIEGTDNSCLGATFTNNQIGPSGHAPSGLLQQKRDVGMHGVGEWADGISLACKGSLVQGNVITDATDGGIVIFGAPGSIVSGNTIVANNRVLMGGINLVDYAPFSGSFTETLVKDNFIFSNTTMIKVGIAVGTLVWGSITNPAGFTYGGNVTGNRFSSGPAGYFAYGLPIGGHFDGTVLNNSFDDASFGGIPSPSCTVPGPPGPAALIIDPTTTSGGSLQPGYASAHISFLICKAPSALLSVLHFTFSS